MRQDQDLLIENGRKGGESSFEELVQRHLPLVYSAAIHRVGWDSHLAKDVCQTVFIELAQVAPRLKSESAITGWLYRTTRFVAAKMVRSEVRRRNRESAVANDTDFIEQHPASTATPDNWEALFPDLDDVINELAEKDRSAILLRYYQKLDFRSVGAALGASEDTARKRVERALEKLRSLLAQRGVTLSVSAIAMSLGSNTASAVPTGLAAAIAAGVKSAGAKGAAVGVLSKWGLALQRYKLMLGAAAALAVATVITMELTGPPPPLVTYDLGRDFPTSLNATSAWSFGWTPTLGGTFTRFGHRKNFLSDNGTAITAWQVTDSQMPSVAKNVDSRTAISVGGAFVAPPETIWFTPEIDASPRNYSVIRLTVPRGHAGRYRIAAAVRSAFDGPVVPGDSEFHVLRNGKKLSGEFVEPDGGKTYTDTVRLAVGDTIDFVAGRGRNPTDRNGLKIHATLTTDLGRPQQDLSAVLRVAPIIVAAPQSRGEPLGSPVSFEVSTGGSTPIQYQWWRDGLPIPGATGNVFSLPAMEARHAGNYFVTVSNLAGVITSSVARLSLATCALVPRGLVSWWSGEGTAADRFGGQHGERSTGVVFEPGRVGRAFHFQQDNSGVRIPASRATDIGSQGSFTVEMWVKPTVVAGKLPLAGWNSEDAYGVNLSIANGRLYASIRDETGEPRQLISDSAVVSAAAWTHIALAFEGRSGNMRLYANGEVVADEQTEPFRPNTKLDLRFGWRREGRGSLHFVGLMDEIAVYDRSLMPAEIASIASAGGAGKCVSTAAAMSGPARRGVATQSGAE